MYTPIKNHPTGMVREQLTVPSIINTEGGLPSGEHFHLLTRQQLPFLDFLSPILVHQPDGYIEKLRTDPNMQNKFVAIISDIFNPLLLTGSIRPITLNGKENLLIHLLQPYLKLTR